MLLRSHMHVLLRKISITRIIHIFFVNNLPLLCCLLFHLSEQRRPVDSLYIVNWMGELIEYVMDVHPRINTADKVTDDSLLDATETARARWLLTRSVKTT